MEKDWESINNKNKDRAKQRIHHDIRAKQRIHSSLAGFLSFFVFFFSKFILNRVYLLSSIVELVPSAFSVVRSAALTSILFIPLFPHAEPTEERQMRCL